jgi:GNAT superfamily N-acetyltransferase
MMQKWTEATGDDAAEILPLLEDFYREERLVFDLDTNGGALRSLLSDVRLGRVFVLRSDRGFGGYLIATMGFSVEFGGVFVLLDELYVAPEFRGKGAWREGFAAMEKWAAGLGISAIRLEVNHHNEKARTIYLKYGFRDDERGILTLRI